MTHCAAARSIPSSRGDSGESHVHHAGVHHAHEGASQQADQDQRREARPGFLGRYSRRRLPTCRFKKVSSVIPGSFSVD